jgi:fructose-1,6-bisphosphatase/inositol monophosphatase family enzyme
MRIEINPQDWGSHGEAVQFMVRFALEAGEQLKRVPVRGRTASYKPDGTPVTAWDRETERRFRTAVATRFPDDGVLGEEYGGGPGDRIWLIDPIDGTANYMTGLGPWAIGIALVLHGEPVASTIYLPDSDVLYVASVGRPGAYRNGTRMDQGTTTSGIVAGSGVDRWRSPAIFDPLMVTSATGGPGLQIAKLLHPLPTMARGCALAEGGIDGTVHGGQGPWDVAPLVPILEGLGMKVTALDGGDQRYDRPIRGAVMSSGEPLHTALVEQWHSSIA